MQLIEGLNQNTPEWDIFRSAHFGASEAAAMLGVSPYMTRDALLRQKKTGIAPEVSEYQQRIFDKGHAIEALLRSYAEELLEQELFPCVGVLEGTKLSASFDGLTMDGKTVWECKSLNHVLHDCLANKTELPLHYRVQLEQQLLVSGAEKVLFMAGELDPCEEAGISECLDCEYTSDNVLRQRILDGWQQFEKDLEAYHVKEAQAPIIGQSPDSNNPLPVLTLQASGQLIASNLDDFKNQALNALAQINTDLQTDQDFADAEQSAKWCKQVAGALNKAIDTLLSGAGIALTVNELEAIKARFNSTRLTLDKTIKSKKDSLKQALVQKAKQRVTQHTKALNEGLPDEYHLGIPAGLTVDLTAAIKGLKTLSSIQNALDSVVLKYQSEANQAFQRQQQAQAAALAAENTPPVSSSEAELAPLFTAGEQLHLLNQTVYPLQILKTGFIHGLETALSAGDWQAIKQALIDHIEKAIPA